MSASWQEKYNRVKAEADKAAAERLRAKLENDKADADAKLKQQMATEEAKSARIREKFKAENEERLAKCAARGLSAKQCPASAIKQ